MRLMRVIAVLFVCSVTLVGQTNKGGISGTVFDPNGAAVPGATVTITNLGTGQKSTVTTTDTGAFSAQSLDPVTYSILVEAKGFKKALLDHVKVDTAATATANVSLETGSVSEQVVVTADAPLLNTETGTTSHTITTRQLQDVPLNNRSVLDLALTAPNVTGDAGSEDLCGRSRRHAVQVRRIHLYTAHESFICRIHQKNLSLPPAASREVWQDDGAG